MAGYSLSMIKRVNKSSTPFTHLARCAIERDVSIVDIAKHLGVSRTAVYAWFMGRYMPNDDNFYKLGEYLER